MSKLRVVSAKELTEAYVKELISKEAEEKIFFNVMKYGATGNGETDDYAAITKAMEAAAAKKGVLWFPYGTYITGTKITWLSGVSIKGAHWNGAIIKAKNGTNLTAVLETENYGAAGANGCVAMDIKVDGNLTNNPTGGTNIKIDGQNIFLDRVLSINAKGNGFDNQITTENQAQIEGLDTAFNRCRAINVRGSGFRIGAHDTVLDDCQAIQCTEVGFNQVKNCYMDTCHAWCYSSEAETVTKVGYKLTGNAQCFNCVSEGASEQMVLLTGANARWYGGEVFCSSGKPNVTCFEINGGTAFDISGVYVHEYGTGGAFKFTTDGGSGSKVRAHCFDTGANPAGIGTPNEGMLFDVTTGGSGGWGTMPQASRRFLTFTKFTPGSVPNNTVYTNNADGLFKHKDNSGVTRQVAEQGEENVSSASTITVSARASVVKITGSTEVKKINATVAGHVLVLRWESTAKLVKGENLKLPATIEPTAEDSCIIHCDGTNWYLSSPLQANS